jgi:biliverdin reductase
MMYNSSAFLQTGRVRVGLVGTGYAAKIRAESFLHHKRSHLVAIAGNHPDITAAFAQEYEAEAISTWQALVQRDDIDLVVVCNINSLHGDIAQAALEAGKHVIVEYPLSLDVEQAEALIALAKAKKLLLHVEHIEILGGVHQALKENLSQIGYVFYARYNTISPKHPAPRKWTYNHELFGFPLVGALSRLHRLIDLFGDVFTVNCHNRFWQTEDNYYQSCFCVAQLSFEDGLLGQVMYAKGETIWKEERRFEIHGEKGGLIFDGDKGILIRTGENIPIEVSSRRGVFAKDTDMVLEHLIDGVPLYITPEKSLYTLKVAYAAKRSAETGLTVVIDN